MLHVLVIDSEPVLRATWRYLLEGCGYQVRSAATGATGAELCREHAPELVIVDVEAAQHIGEGLSTIEQVRTEAPEVPILVLSPWNLDRDKAIECGATACVSKPVDYATVLRLTDMMVSHAAAQRWSSLVGERD